VVDGLDCMAVFSFSICCRLYSMTSSQLAGVGFTLSLYHTRADTDEVRACIGCGGSAVGRQRMVDVDVL